MLCAEIGETCSNWPGPMPSGYLRGQLDAGELSPEPLHVVRLEARALTQECERRGDRKSREEDSGRRDHSHEEGHRSAPAPAPQGKHAEHDERADDEVQPGRTREREDDAHGEDREEGHLRCEASSQKARGHGFLQEEEGGRDEERSEDVRILEQALGTRAADEDGMAGESDEEREDRHGR